MVLLVQILVSWGPVFDAYCFFITVNGGITVSLASEVLDGGLVWFVFFPVDVFYIYLMWFIWAIDVPGANVTW